MFWFLGMGPQIWQLNQGIYCSAEAKLPRQACAVPVWAALPQICSSTWGGSCKLFYEEFPLLLA